MQACLPFPGNKTAARVCFPDGFLSFFLPLLCQRLHTVHCDYDRQCHQQDTDHKPDRAPHRIRSEIAALDGLEGAFTVCGAWPGVRTAESFPLGGSWWTDCADSALFGGPWHGFRTVADHREAVLEEWAARWNALKE